MCLNFAEFGFQIEHKAGDSTKPNADIVIKRTPKGKIYVNGMVADLKSTKSEANIMKYARHAIDDQGAKIVLFEFTSREKEAKILEKIAEATRKGYHGYYYFTGDKKATIF